MRDGKMRRRLGREDLRIVSPFLKDKEAHAPFTWQVYEDYEIVDQEDGPSYIRAVGEVVNGYYPLVDTPHLFLDFARIAEQKAPGEALAQWINKYGLLGLAHGRPQYIADIHPEVVIPPHKYDPRGGPGETLEAVWYEVWEANEVLLLYEAALNRDAETLGRVLYPTEEDRGRDSMEKNAAGPARTRALIGRAVAQIWEYLGSLRVHAYPAVGYRGEMASDHSTLTLDGLMASWGVRSLLATMILQFYWLVTSEGGLARCKQCSNPISYTPPIPGSTDRKPRKDKEFCSRQCRQNHHYQTRVKPARKGKSA